ncbi:MAG: hypothetical protein CME62_03115 [Halobacteriovoraceae bacterium]|nr:hypothetical protein [Halobacteriovoraceae bacterium]|tara:strand:+ start:2356 stop:4167 length:1812 start_codon:yes stop_codon:yes gene_type:complete
MILLGIAAYYHDSAVAIIKDGVTIYAQSEERLTRVKNDSRFPFMALEAGLNELGLTEEDIDEIVFYDKPWLKFERILDSTLTYAPTTLPFFLKALPPWLSKKLNFRKLLKNEMGEKYPKLALKKIHFSEHHFSHAASSFYTSPFQSACVVTIDGVGEWATLCIYKFNQESFQQLYQMNYPHSVGLLYSAFTQFCGFKVNSGEYKLMGLAPYGDIHSPQTEEFIQKIKSKLVSIHKDGSITLNLDYFLFHKSDSTIHKAKFEKLFGINCKTDEMTFNQSYKNFALAAQVVTEEIILKVMNFAKEVTGEKNLCYSGGVSLNCVANKKIVDSGLFEKVWIQPAAGDAGGAVGAALGFYYSQYAYHPITNFNPYLGDSFSSKQIEYALNVSKLPYKKLDLTELIDFISTQLMDSKIIGLFQGRSEWGPRALGNRSILADPRGRDMQKKLNLKIKFREDFRPFAPITRAEDFHQFFEGSANYSYMQFTAEVLNSSLRENSGSDRSLSMLESPLPAITHFDNSARVQTVTKDQNDMIHRLLSSFKEKTGIGVLVNTSFNVRGEPIINSPQDAIDCFLSTEIDILVLENYLVLKSDLENFKIHKRIFAPD